CLIPAGIILVNAGSRAQVVVAAVLSITVICLPFITRWIAPATAMFAAISAFVLPGLITSAQSLIMPLMSLAPGRVSDVKSVATLEGRTNIWERSIRYWIERVNDVPHMLFGFGVDGHYRSGASSTYSEQLSSIIRDPERAGHVHNTFLQQ